MLQCSQPPWMTAGPHVQDGFPQQRGCSDRSLGNQSISARSESVSPLTPLVVAAGASSYQMKIETLSIDFTDEQKRYLEGFTSGLQINRAGRALGGASTKASADPGGP